MPSRIRSIFLAGTFAGVLALFMIRPSIVHAQTGDGATRGTVVDPAVAHLIPVTGEAVNPVFLTHAGDGSGRIFVVERGGRIRIIEDGQMLPAPFLDISRKVATGGECGMLSLAFAPDYAASGEFYVYYSYGLGDLVAPALPDEPNGGCDTVVARFSVDSDDANRADAESEEIVLAVNQPYLNHNGGQLQFGPDGYLYIGLGDGGSGGDPHNLAHNPAGLLGKLLRIDVAGQATYAVPADNPFIGAPGYRPEIWAVGLRNPWRFSFDRQTGDLYIGDVGQGLVEEIDFQPAASRGGEDYGWRTMEGDRCYNAEACDQTGLTAPVFTYDHAQPNCGGSVTGGYVYRTDEASPLSGRYIFGDYCLRQIWALTPSGQPAAAQEWSGELLMDVPFSVMSFGEDEAGALYVLGSDNTIYLIMSMSVQRYLPLIRQQPQ
ncbi:MAG: PQQ-dependent sugar dehydrogenase [Caldilineaceae bacterium]|nr:PQQ-dependent sugar dehydrogenase [Caldilineaceae bacterium]